MSREALILLLAAAAIAVPAGRGARSSKLMLALAATSCLVVLDLLAAWLLGYVGCSDRPGGCPDGAGVARTILVVAVPATVALLLAVGVRRLWRTERRRSPAGRPSKLVLAAAAAAGLFVLDLMAAGLVGDLRCSDRPGGCTGGAAVARDIRLASVLAVVALLMAVAVRWLWRRTERWVSPPGGRPRAGGLGEPVVHVAGFTLKRDPYVVFAGTGFVLVSLPMLIFGPRVVGLGGLLLGVVGLLAFLSERLPDGSGPRLRRVEEGGVMRPAVVVLAGRRRRAVQVLGCGLAMVVSLLVLLMGEILVGLVGCVVLGAATLFQLVALRKPHGLALLPDGLRWLGTGGVFVPWDDIVRAELFFLKTHLPDTGAGYVESPAYLGLDLGGRAAIDPALGPFNRWTTRGEADVSFPLAILGVEPELLLEAVRLYVADPQARREIGSEASLRRLTRGLAGTVVGPRA